MALPRPRLKSIIGFALVAALVLGVANTQSGGEPGRFDYYVLVIGWTPSYCANEGRERHDRECSLDRPHSFTLHGLWPQNTVGWPQDCRTKRRPWVPQSVIDEMREIMPNKKLVIHEYRVHGTCSGLAPDQYFGLARDLYDRVSIPPRFSATDRLTLSQDEIEGEFLKANPWLKPNMMVVSCRGRNLLDVRICFGRDLFPRPCGQNEENRVCRTNIVTVPAAQGR